MRIDWRLPCYLAAPFLGVGIADRIQYPMLLPAGAA